jgi:hypothetical protein
MALSRLFPADFVFQTLDGQEPAAGGSIYFNNNGTAALSTVDTDLGAVTPSANPLELGADGRLRASSEPSCPMLISAWLVINQPITPHFPATRLLLWSYNGTTNAGLLRLSTGSSGSRISDLSVSASARTSSGCAISAVYDSSDAI